MAAEPARAAPRTSRIGLRVGAGGVTVLSPSGDLLGAIRADDPMSLLTDSLFITLIPRVG
ncbi:hypothetical protein I553_0953 [Mycobacterium xenopi 4042]|uniref:Uncharacterized protein n=1 Tax=Mycobacterium xenopi 4042 TaxID=1299334 RepID=X7ZB37_MYCXE|nr:hypothetical protein I553_0953 [Mycobacterium xenopi 4042]